MKNNKKGGLLGFAFWIIMFICVWAAWLGGFLAEWGARNVNDNVLTGLEAMFYSNLNLWVFLGLITIIYLGIRMGGGQQ
jgi:hypothetical protein